MRNRKRILENLESLYRESYDRAREEGHVDRMAELDNAYMRDQLLYEVLLDLGQTSMAGMYRASNAVTILAS